MTGIQHVKGQANVEERAFHARSGCRGTHQKVPLPRPRPLRRHRRQPTAPVRIPRHQLAHNRGIVAVRKMRHEPGDQMPKLRERRGPRARIRTGAGRLRRSPPPAVARGRTSALILAERRILVVAPVVGTTLTLPLPGSDAVRMRAVNLTVDIVPARTKRPTAGLAARKLLRHDQPPFRTRQRVNQKGKNMPRKRRSGLFLRGKAGEEKKGKKIQTGWGRSKRR